MVDLMHWEFAEKFNGFDAAALILGLEPTEAMGDEHRINVVMQRMRSDYHRAILAASYAVTPFGDSDKFPSPDDDFLLSIRLEDLWNGALRGQEQFLDRWISENKGTAFDVQTFRRETLANWLTAIGMDSRYPFARSDRQNVPFGSVGRWPWGNHSTQMLDHLAAAAQRYYGANYDPNDATTAPTNASVSEWLQTYRKVSKSMADAIASMLRPDGLPTGPRK